MKAALTRALFVAFLLCELFSSSAVAQEVPLKVEACELQRNPLTYHHKFVQVRSRVTLAFEDFSLSPEDCGAAGNGGWVWLELGGDAGPQTVYCCGDHFRPKKQDIQIDGLAIPLRRDVNLEQFIRLLSAKRDRAPDGGPCYDCTYFRVSATLTGRFFAGGWGIAKEGQALPEGGYGHLGCCSLLVIEDVADVTAKRTEVISGTHFSCMHRDWHRGSNEKGRAILIRETAENSELWRTQDFSRVALEAVRTIAKEWNSTVPTTTPEIYQDVSRKYERAKGTWTSGDLLLRYDIELRKLGELQPQVGSQLREVWVPYIVKQEVCDPRS